MSESRGGRRPRGNPPRWLGGLAVVSGLATLLGWLYLVDTLTGGVILTIGIVGTLLFLIILGVWLLIQPERDKARPATG